MRPKLSIDVRRRVRELAGVVVGAREDASLVTPVLALMLETAIQDFGRYYESRQASARIADHDLLRAKWIVQRRRG